MLHIRQVRAHIRQVRPVFFLQVLRRATVVGMTTTALAKFSAVVAALEAEVLLVEEAAEVLESHLLVALSPSTRHLLLVGDPAQLRPGTRLEPRCASPPCFSHHAGPSLSGRPGTAVHKLGRQFRLDVCT